MQSKRRTLSKANFFLVRAFASIGLCITGYLLIMKLTGEISSIVGCGGEGGCANVLGSKWSAWVHIPVSLLAALFYAAVIALSFQRSRSLLISSALVLIGAALWFMGIMTYKIESFCPWCLATHITGILTAISIFVTTRRTGPVSWTACSIFAIAPLSVLIGGQIWGPEPDTHAISEYAAKTKNKPIHQRGSGRQLTYGGKIFNMAQLPFIGPADAKHVFVKYFDYTCGSCRNMEEDLDKLMEKHPGKFAVVLLPTPLNRKCNSTLKPKIKDHPWACELAKLGLAAWRAQPESFPEVHKRLFSRPILTVEEARREISRIIPKEKLSQSLKDPWINDLIKANTEDSQTLSAQSVVMPKLLIVDTKVFQGVAKSSDIFVSKIEKLFGL
ncbi:vitamin K epoxide reductase family protein [Akkermansiaceae bacterium]|nr:vitamin K epoxide reductase family protein [Akkermansiaceae bacterium]MDB4734104.1 vitamin K epoxide reductase family protein [Akkermansiaceae bacterium]